MKRERTFTVYAALKDHAHEGWVHLHDPGCRTRGIIRISNSSTSRHIYCEALQIGSNFEGEYRESKSTFVLDKNAALVVGKWYREKLGGIATESQATLTIQQCDGMWGSFRACVDHPQLAIRLTTRLAILSVALGITSLALGLLSLRLCVAGVLVGIPGLALMGLAVVWHREWR